MTLATFGNAMKFLNIMASFHQKMRKLPQLALILLLSLSGQQLFAEGSSVQAVGEVQLVLGKAWLESAEHGRRSAEQSAKVYVTDRVVTGANGHVHLKFVDQALVAVRPDSELEIQRYEFNESAPELSSVKFRLEEGITRAISGDAARAARQRFRMNTPIADIGVRGTDFVVSATETTTQATVNEGTIVVAPYSPECSADALGPCVANAVELSGDSLQMLAMTESEPLPRLIPSTSIRNPQMMREEVEGAIASNSDQQSDSDQGDDTRLVASADTAQGDTGSVRASSLEVVQEAVTTPQVTSDADAIRDTQTTAGTGPSGELRVDDFTPATALTYSTLNSRDLIWGRFSFFGPSIDQEDERISVSFAEAATNRDQTLGGLGYHLFRRDLNQEGLQIEQTALSFQLNSAQAYYSSDAGVEAMQVKGGNLDIDLASNLFATELNLEHSATGAVDFNAAGSISPHSGFFHSSSETQSIGGALSIDGREAAYFFEQQLDAGGIQGLTLWDSR